MNHHDELDAIIDRHATPEQELHPRKFRKPLPPQLEPFTAADTQAYQGCNTTKPEIAHLPWGDVVLDGNEVSAVIHEGAWADEITTRLPSEAIARLVATQLLTVDGPLEQVFQELMRTLKGYEPPF